MEIEQERFSTMPIDKLIWELKWVAVEASLVAIGLGLMFSRYEAFSYPMLTGVVVLSGVVRFRHYFKPVSDSRPLADPTIPKH
jgi:hypothetical protein